ncbi:MAG: hypothetical protein ACO3JL_21885, partial [Myxococcota bacterium]
MANGNPAQGELRIAVKTSQPALTQEVVHALAALRVSAFASEGANDAPAAEVWLVEAPPGEEVWGA